MSLVKIEPYITDNVASFTFGGLTITSNATFGNTSLGNLSTANFVSVSSNITAGNANLGNAATANFFIGNGSYLTGISAATAVSIVNGNSNVTIPSANGNISISIGGTSNVAVITTTGINVSGYVNATRFIGEGGNLSNIQAGNISGTIANANYSAYAGAVVNASQGNITSLGLLTALSVNGYSSFIGNANVVGNINVSGGNTNVSGNITANNITTSGSGGNISGANNISANTFTGTLTTAAQPNITSVGTLSSLSVTANISAGNLTGANLVSANYVTGTLTTASQPNITSVGTLSGITGTGTINFTGASNVSLGAVGNVKVTGGSSGQYLQTDGTGNLSWVTVSVTPSSISNGNSNVSIPSSNGNVNISAVGNANVLVVTGTGVNVSGTLNATGNITANNITTSGSSGNISGANNISANTFTGNGSALSSITGANVTGYVPNANIANTAYAVAGGNVSGQVGNALVAGTVYTAAQPNITSLGTLTGLTVSGNTTLTGNLTVSGSFEYANVTTFRVQDPIIEQGGNTAGGALTSNDGYDRGQLLHYYSGGAVDAFMGWDNSNAEFAFGSNVTIASEVATFNTFGNVRAGYFIGNGSQLTGLTGLTVANANYSNYAGTIINASQSNITSVGTLTTLAIASTGNVSGANLVSANYVTGTLTTASQPNITSIGTLSSLSVTANISAGNLTGANLVSANYVTGTLTTASQPNITSVGTLSSLSVTANISAGNINAGNLLTANYSTSVLTTAAQPNITSVGTLSSLAVTGNITSGNANLGNNVTANFFTGSGAYLTSVTAVTAGTVTTNAQPNITSTGTLTTLTVGNATANSTFGNGTITASGNISFTGSNVSLGDVSNLKITGGTSGYFITTDGAGNLSWGAAAGGGGVSATGSNTQIQFNDNGSLGATSNLTFNKTTNTFSTGKIVASAGANLGSNISNIYIGGGGVSQILATDGSGNLTWVAQPTATITVDNFTGDGTTVAYTLSTTPSNINQTIVNYNGIFQLRTSSYTLSGPTLTFSEAPLNGSKIEVTTTMGSTSGAGAFVTRTYTGNGVATTFTVTSGVTVSSVLVTENGLVQTPTTDYTISGTTLTFITAPANGVVIQIRELAIAIATTVSPAYRAYTGNGVATTFTVTSGLTANSLIVAENGIIQRPTTDYTVSGSTLTFVTAPNNGVDIQIRELSLNGGMSTGGTSLPYQGGNSGKYLTTDGATATWSTVSALPTQTGNTGKYLTTDGTTSSWATVTSGVTLGKTVALNMFLGI